MKPFLYLSTIFLFVSEMSFSQEIALGKGHQGGRIGYILQSEDRGYEQGVPHGLIFANLDGSVKWGCADQELPTKVDGIYVGQTYYDFGAGPSNTNAIVKGCRDSGIAAKICSDLTRNGYSDWYLPSLEELKKFKPNKDILGPKGTIGGFKVGPYWSSSEWFENGLRVTERVATVLFYGDFIENFRGREYPANVCCVRSF